jgi:DNA-binding transcriptional LysR family regulator
LHGKDGYPVLSSFSPTFPGFYLYYPSKRQQPAKLKALVNYVRAHSGPETIGMSAIAPALDV